MTHQVRTLRRQRVGLAVTSYIALMACCTMSPPAIDAPEPPWMLRHTFPGWDGKPVEVLGAPGPRAVAAFLSRAMLRAGVSRPQYLGDELRQIPSFYRFHVDQPEDGADAKWHVDATVFFAHIEWEGNEGQMLAGHLQGCVDPLSLPDFALAMSDVVWKWPRRPGSRSFMRPPWSAQRTGELIARLLRDKINSGMPLARAWQELQFQHDDELYVMALLPNGRLRLSWHSEMDERDWPPPPPWEGKY